MEIEGWQNNRRKSLLLKWAKLGLFCKSYQKSNIKN